MQQLPEETAKAIESAVAGSIAAAGRTHASPDLWAGVDAALLRFPFLKDDAALQFLAGACVELGVEIERLRACRIAEAAKGLEPAALAMIVSGDSAIDAIAWLRETAAEEEAEARAGNGKPKIVAIRKDPAADH